MTRYKIVTLGRVKEKFVAEGEAEYLKRLRAFGKVELKELDCDRFGKLGEAERKRREADLLLANVKAGEFLILLDEKGKEFSSESFAKELQKAMNSGVSAFTFAIGGPFGFDAPVKNSAKLVWSLSKLTFPYQLTRLIVIEQLYRAAAILKGHPYHK